MRSPAESFRDHQRCACECKGGMMNQAPCARRLPGHVEGYTSHPYAGMLFKTVAPPAIATRNFPCRIVGRGGDDAHLVAVGGEGFTEFGGVSCRADKIGRVIDTANKNTHVSRPQDRLRQIWIYSQSNLLVRPFKLPSWAPRLTR